MMLHNDIKLSRLMVYAKSIKESELSRISRNLKRGRFDKQKQPRFKNRAPNQDESSARKANYERGGGSQIVKPTFSTCVSVLGSAWPELMGALVVEKMIIR